MTSLQLREHLGEYAVQLKQLTGIAYSVQMALAGGYAMPEDTAGALELLHGQLETVADGLGQLACLKCTVTFVETI